MFCYNKNCYNCMFVNYMFVIMKIVTHSDLVFVEVVYK